MKKLIYSITAIIAFAVSANAQVGVETTSVSDKAILDFPDAAADGAILLPYIENVDTGSVEGTIMYDTASGTVQVYNGTDWVAYAPDESGNVASPTHDTTTYPEKENAEGVVISDTTESGAPGVLVLDTTTKALALPKVDGVENLQAPKAGMICYDTSRNALAIFNGENWILRN